MQKCTWWIVETNLTTKEQEKGDQGKWISKGVFNCELSNGAINVSDKDTARKPKLFYIEIKSKWRPWNIMIKKSGLKVNKQKPA